MRKQRKAFTVVELVIVIAVIAILAAVLIAAALTVFFVWRNIEGQKISGIQVSSYPERVRYYVGDKADFEGLTVQVLRKNGEFYLVDEQECEITGFDSSEPVERQKILVRYEDFSCSFTVQIVALPTPVKTLSAVEVEILPKTEYKVGESLDTSGGVLKLIYTDGSVYRVDLLNRFVSGFSSQEPNDALVLTVKYSENGVLVQTTYTVTVSET